MSDYEAPWCEKCQVFHTNAMPATTPIPLPDCDLQLKLWGIASRFKAEEAAEGYNALNYNVSVTPQQACGQAILEALAALDKENE